jgi:hypothetical protein
MPFWHFRSKLSKSRQCGQVSAFYKSGLRNCAHKLLEYTWDVGRGTWDVGPARTNRSSVGLGVSLLQEVANVPVAVVAADTVPLFLLSHLLLRWWQIGALHR